MHLHIQSEVEKYEFVERCGSDSGGGGGGHGGRRILAIILNKWYSRNHLDRFPA